MDITWSQAIRLLILCLAYFLKIRSSEILWNRRDKQDEKYKDIQKHLDDLRDAHRDNDAERLRDEVAGQQGQLDALSAELSLLELRTGNSDAERTVQASNK